MIHENNKICEKRFDQQNVIKCALHFEFKLDMWVCHCARACDKY